MAAAIVVLLAADTFATGFLLRQVLHLNAVIAQQGEHLVAVGDELAQLSDLSARG